MQNKIFKVQGRPFVSHVDQDKRPEIEVDLVDIYTNVCHFQLSNIKSYGKMKVMGYAFDLRPHLSKYIVKQYGRWDEYYAPNKTLLRKSIYGRIEKIVESKP